VEEALLSHPDVLDAAAVARADRTGALRHHVKERPAPFTHPRRIEVLPEPPKAARDGVRHLKPRASETAAAQAAG
jgi:acyl-coenzyme A synthetase/AMP-(fatty) acid ligase